MSVSHAPRPLRLEVVLAPTLGGAELSMLDLLDSAAARLDPSFVVLGDGPVVGELRGRGWPVVLQTVRPAVGSVSAAVGTLATRWRRSDGLDAVLANGVKGAAVALPAARLAGVRAAWFKRDYSYDTWLAAPLARLADLVVANSSHVGAATRREDVVVVPPPRPPAPLERARARDRLEALGTRLDDGLLVAAVGRLVGYKGVDDLVEALALPEAASWRLAVIGVDDPADPGEHRRLEQLAAARGVAGRVTFLGVVPEAGRLLSGVDAVAVTTKTDAKGFGREGFSRVALEAMAAATPVIATTGGAVSDRLGAAGVAVPPASPPALAGALRRLEDAAVRESMGRSGARLAAEHPDADECAARLLSALSGMAGRPGAGLAPEKAITVVTTVLNEGAAVERLLDDLVPQLGESDELIVVDGGLTDDTAERVARRASVDDRIRPLSEPGTNIPAGRNRGIAAASNALVACTDAGCRPSPAWLDSLKAGFGERPAADLLTGVYQPAARTPFQHAMAAACYPDVREARRPGTLVRAYGRLFGSTFEPSLPTGRSSAFTREAWSRVGGFPEELATAEDVSFGRAIAAEGGSCVLCLDAAVTWEQRPTIRETARMYARYGAGDARSGDVLLVGRNLVRAGAYGLAPLLVLSGGRLVRGVVVAGAALYASVPLLRARRRPRAALVAALVPAALALKDVSKAAGCLAELLRRGPR